MKAKHIILVLLFLSCLAFVGCSNPYDTIKEQKKQIDELIAKLDKCNLDAQEKCARGAQHAFHDAGYDKETLAGYVCHYNKKLNKCFMEISFSILNKDKTATNSKSLFDVFERKEYANVTTFVPNGKKYYEVKPSHCTMLDNACATEAEYDAFVKPHMEE